jgi:AraC family transcriptional regulator
MNAESAIRSSFPVSFPRSRHATATRASDPRHPIDDPVLHHLGACLRTLRALPSEISPICVDHVSAALEAYLAPAASGEGIAPAFARGGLAPWQLRRATEILASRVDGNVSLTELARAVDLSPSHFARAFKQTTGKPPHRWLLELRIEKAKEMLLGSGLPLAEIALTCGFTDQSHFTRVFSRIARSSPGAWRRARCTGPRMVSRESVRGTQVRDGRATATATFATALSPLPYDHAGAR